MPDEKDPWASLADTLGAGSAPEPASPPPSGQQRQQPKPRPEAKRPAAQRPASASWGDIDDTLGLPPSRDAAPAPERPAPRPIEPRAAESRPAEPREIGRAHV